MWGVATRGPRTWSRLDVPSGVGARSRPSRRPPPARPFGPPRCPAGPGRRGRAGAACRARTGPPRSPMRTATPRQCPAASADQPCPAPSPRLSTYSTTSSTSRDRLRSGWSSLGPRPRRLTRWQVNRSARCSTVGPQSRSPSPMTPCRNTSGGPWPCTELPIVTPSVVVTWWVRRSGTVAPRWGPSTLLPGRGNFSPTTGYAPTRTTQALSHRPMTLPSVSLK